MMRLIAVVSVFMSTWAVAQPRPNVVIVMTDDQGVGDFGFMGNPIIKTPQLDKMASRSVHMTNFWVSPVCAPTRASLMTGRYNYRTRCIDTYIGRAMMDTAEVTLAEHFSAGGYATGIFGKWHLGDNAPMRPQDQGFDEVLVHRGGGIGQPSDVIGAEGKYTNPTLIHNGKEEAFTGYCTDIYFKHAMQFMAREQARHRPFLSVITTNAPHGPFHDVPEDLYQAYKQVDFAPYSVQPLSEKLHDNLRRIGAMITNIDDNIGLLFAFLKDEGLYENTIVIFLTDNGPNSLRYVGPYRGMKSHVHTGGILTPMLFHWPNKIKTGVKRSQLAAHYDIAPTLLAACDIDKQGDLPFDGVNILPAILHGQPVAPNRSLYIQSHRGDQPESEHHFAVIGSQYKLLRPSGFGRETNPGNVPLELYDHRADPGERHDLAASRPALVQSMLADYRRWFSDVSTTRADNYAPPRIEVGRRDENPVVLTRQDWRHFQGRPWAGGSNGKWLLTLKKSLTVSMQLYLTKNASPPKIVRVMNGERLIRTVNVNGSALRIDDVVLPRGHVDLWFELVRDDATTGPYQVHLSVHAGQAHTCGHWPDWRGPTQQGHSEASGLPLHWSETKNIVWKTAIHDLGYSTPVVWGNQIWLTTATKKGETLYAVCLDLNSGRIVYDIPVFRPKKPQRIHRYNSYATPSAVIEEGFVYVNYGSHGTACINTKTGKIVWQRDDLNCAHLQGPVSSPLLYEDLLIVPLEGTDVQFVVALDTKTGEQVWRYDRPRELYDGIEPAYKLKSYYTPIVITVRGQDQLINSGAMLATGHEPRTGKELWRVLYRDDNPVSRVVSGLGLMFINSGGEPGNSHLYAVRQGGVGDITDSHVVWKMEDDVPSESAPVLVDDLLYLLTDIGLLTCKQATTGETVWSERLEGKYGASLLYADHRIYLSNKAGQTTIIQPGREFKVLAVNQLDGFLGASPAVAGKSLLLRSKTHLYRVEKP